MEIIISYAFAHIIEAIMAGHAVMFGVFLTGNIYFITAINNSMYIVLMALMFNVSKRSAVFWALIYNAMMAISEQLVFYVLQFIVGIRYIELKNTMSIIIVFCLCKILYFILIQIMVVIKNKSRSSDRKSVV